MELRHGEMSKHVAYRVVQSSSDRTFITGDIIWITKNGDICVGYGWITPSEVERETLDFLVVPDYNYYVDVTANSEGLRRRVYDVVVEENKISFKPAIIVMSDNKHNGYLCPICKANGVETAIDLHTKNCPCCGVNLNWEDA